MRGPRLAGLSAAASRPEASASVPLAVVYELGIAEGERRALSRMGIQPAPQPSRAPARHLHAVPDTEPELEAEP